MALLTLTQWSLGTARRFVREARAPRIQYLIDKYDFVSMLCAHTDLPESPWRSSSLMRIAREVIKIYGFCDDRIWNKYLKKKCVGNSTRVRLCQQQSRVTHSREIT